MVISKESVIGFWLGVALLAVINMVLFSPGENLFAFNGYVFLASFLILAFFMAIKLHLLKPRHR